MRLFIFTLSLLFVSTFSFAQSVEEHYYHAYLENDLEGWDKGITKANDQYEETEAAEYLLQMAKGAYGAIITCFAKQDMDTAEEWVEKAEEYCDAYLDEESKSAEGKALMAGVYGFKIALSPMKGMFLGSKSGRLLDEALNIDPKCALAHYHKGTSAYNTPEQWGGDKEAAMGYFSQAQSAYECQSLAYSWEYLNTLSWLGISQHGNGQYEAAAATYEMALILEPSFGWIKYVLMPKTEAVLAER